MNKLIPADNEFNPKTRSQSSEEEETDFIDNNKFESDKNLIVEVSPKGRFSRFNEELGYGAYKTVYKGVDNDSACEVAWNVIKLHRLPQRERKRISDEIALLKALKHPNIINFISAWINKQKDEVVFITEIVTGGSIKKYLKKIKSPRLKVIKTWCKEILQGIEYLHTLKPNPIIHRDIKCENIFINSNKGEIRIGDLGLATCMSNAVATSVLGTPEFMAPEMYEEGYGTSVDIYSFGMCVLEMVTLQTPYKECMNAAQIYRKVINGIKPASLNLIANEDVKAFVLECLRDKDSRLTATELLKHKFLQITDSEADNSPVPLKSSSLMGCIEEEQSQIFDSRMLRTNQLKEDLSIEELKEKMRVDDTKLLTKMSSTLEKNLTPTTASNNNDSIGINQDNNAIEYSKLKIELDEFKLFRSECKKEKDTQGVNENKKLANYIIEYRGYKFIANIVCVFLAIKREDKERGVEIPFEMDIHDLTLEHLANEVSKTFNVDTNNPLILNNLNMIIGIVEHGLNITNSFCQSLNKNKMININSMEIKDKQKLQEGLGNLSNISAEDNQIKKNGEQKPKIISSSKSAENPTSITTQKTMTNQAMNTTLSFPILTRNNVNGNIQDETEDQMTVRHKLEKLELNSYHTNQKREILDKICSTKSNLVGTTGNNTMKSTGSNNSITPINTNNNSNITNTTYSPIGNGDNAGFVSTDPIEDTHPASNPNNVAISQSNTCNQNSNGAIINSNLAILTKDPAGSNTNNLCDHATKSTIQISSSRQELNSPVLVNKQHSGIVDMNAQKIIKSSSGTGENKNTIYAPMQNIPPISNNSVSSINTTSSKDSNPNIEAMKKSTKPENEQFSQQQIYQYQVNPNQNQSINNLSQQSFQINPDNSIKNPPQKQNSVLAPGIFNDQKSTNIPNTNTSNIISNNRLIDTTYPQQQNKKNIPNNPIQVNPITPSNQTQSNINQVANNASNNNFNIAGFSSQPNLQKPDTLIKASIDQKIKKVTSVQQMVSTNANSPDKLINMAAKNATTEQQQLNPNNTLSQAAQAINLFPSALNNSNIKNPSTVVYLSNSSTSSSSNNPSISGSMHNSSSQLNTTPLVNQTDIQCNNKNSLANENFKTNETENKKQNIAAVYEKLKNYKIKGILKRDNEDQDKEDVQNLQTCLEYITGEAIINNSHFGRYTEKAVKSFQEKINVPTDGIVTIALWQKMIETLQKKVLTKEQGKEKEKMEMVKNAEENKKKLKSKQNMEASESMNKIESNLIDLSDLRNPARLNNIN